MSDSPSSASEIIELAPDEIIRVLQVRPRTRFQATSPAPVAAAPLARPAVVTPPPVTTVSAPPPAVPAFSKKRERSLEETLDDLQALVTMDSEEDTGSTTGVRHLHVELEKPVRAKKR